MKIECIIKRPNGTKVEMDQVTYHFKPSNDDLRHIAEVNDSAHISMFLRVRDAYQALDGETIPDEVSKKVTDATLLAGSAIHHTSYEIAGGQVIKLPDLITQAHDDSGLTIEAWNELPDQERYEYIDATLDELRNPPHVNEVDQEDAPAPIEPAEPEQPAAAEEKSEAPAEPEPAEKPAPATDEPNASAKEEVDPAKDEQSEMDTLREAYKKEFGRYPNSRMSTSSIRKALENA